VKSKRHEEIETPLAVIAGEYWQDRKAEIAAMGRAALEQALGDAGVLTEDDAGACTMLWLRKRLAYVGQVEFYLERSLQPPEAVLERAAELDKQNGVTEPWEVDFFRDARATAQEEADYREALAGAQARKKAALEPVPKEE
jgi:hypothetical protein